MSVLFILVIFSLMIASAFLCAFIWSVRTEQFSDQEGASMRMLMDDDLQEKQ